MAAMSSPMDAVTRTVNALVTALKMPDDSAKANDILGQMNFPQFSRVNRTGFLGES
ncbi:MAG: hypothetical protein VB135_02945 [Burkholderia sp.]